MTDHEKTTALAASTEPHQFADGDLVREKGGDVVYELDDVNPATAEERQEAGEYWASGTSEGYRTREWDTPDAVELVLSAEAAANRTPPTAAELVQQVASGLHGGFAEHVNVFETEADGTDSVLAYGTTPDGLRVSFRITVTNIEPYL